MSNLLMLIQYENHGARYGASWRGKVNPFLFKQKQTEARRCEHKKSQSTFKFG